MWSSLSSYLYSDDGEKTPGHVAVNHGRARGGVYPQNGSSATESSARGTPRARVESADSRGLQSSLHSTSSNSSGGTRRIPQLSASRLSASISEGESATTILRAVVVGDRHSGKTCLIQRLRGDDPFAKRRASESPRRRNRGNPMALIPWSVPNDSCSPTATVVQLYVSEGSSFNYSKKDSCKEQWRANLKSQRGKDIDFVIWMVDPRNSETAQVLKHGLDLILEESAVQNLCILLNFRDTQLTERTDQQSTFHCIRREIECAIEKLARKNEEVEYPQTIMVYESSMKNCFGLQNLHSFITLPYLAFLEGDLRRRADDVCKKRLQRRSRLLNSPLVLYDEFISNVSGPANVHQEESRSAELERQHLEVERERLRQRLKEQNRVLNGRLHEDERTSSNSKPKEGESRCDRPGLGGGSTDSDPAKRTLFVKSETLQPPRPPKAATPTVVLEENLDSFFSDSESDEEEQEEDINRSEVIEEVYADDESDDGDFYIDGSGQSHSHSDETSNAVIKSSAKPDALRPDLSELAESEVSRSELDAHADAATEQVESNDGTDEPPEGMRKAPEPIPDDVSTSPRALVHAEGVADQSRRAHGRRFQDDMEEEVECGGDTRAAGVDPAPSRVAGGGEDSGLRGARKEDDGIEETAKARIRDESAEETGPLEPSAGDGDSARSTGDQDNAPTKPSARIGLEEGSESNDDGKCETKPDENPLRANDGVDEDCRSRSQEEGSREDAPLDGAGKSANRVQVPLLCDSDDDAKRSADRVLDIDGGGDPSASGSDASVPHRSSPEPEKFERYHVLDSDSDSDDRPPPAVGRADASPPADPPLPPVNGTARPETRPSPEEKAGASSSLSAAAASAIESARAEAERMAAMSSATGPEERSSRKSKKSKKKKDGKKKDKKRRKERLGTDDGE